MTTEIDVTSEESRTYHYGNGVEFTVPEPLSVFVITDDRGVTHRVTSGNGRTYRPERNWSGISWKPREGAANFVA